MSVRHVFIFSLANESFTFCFFFLFSWFQNFKRHHKPCVSLRIINHFLSDKDQRQENDQKDRRLEMTREKNNWWRCLIMRIKSMSCCWQKIGEMMNLVCLLPFKETFHLSPLFVHLSFLFHEKSTGWWWWEEKPFILESTVEWSDWNENNCSWTRFWYFDEVAFQSSVYCYIYC